MIKNEDLRDAEEFIVSQWGLDGTKVALACSREVPFNNTFDAFLDECIATGGNWGGMLLSGIKKLYPRVYNAIPDQMGRKAFECLCNVLVLLGVDTSDPNRD